MPPLTQHTLNGETYWEARIGDVQPDTPIVLAVHYMGGDASSLAYIFDDFPHPLRLIALQAHYPSGDAEHGGYSWFPDEEAWYNRPQTAQAPDIHQQMERITAFLRAYKGDQPAKTIAVGMSQGGDLTLSLVAHHPDMIDLAIPCAGRLSAPMRPESVNKAVGLPIVHLKHGVDDAIVPIATSREATSWLQSVGYNATLQEYAGVGHTLSDAVIADIRRFVEAFVG